LTYLLRRDEKKRSMVNLQKMKSTPIPDNFKELQKKFRFFKVLFDFYQKTNEKAFIFFYFSKLRKQKIQIIFKDFRRKSKKKKRNNRFLSNKIEIKKLSFAQQK
jgi:hypothetical protein